MQERFAEATEFNWKAVKVSFAGEGDTNNNDDPVHPHNHTSVVSDAVVSHSLQEKNHYDNPSLQKMACKDLEASPEEAAGIFFGLEVLDGNSYRIQEDPDTHQKVMIPMQPLARTGKASTGKTASALNANSVIRRATSAAVLLLKDPNSNTLAITTTTDSTQAKRRKRKRSIGRDKDGDLPEELNAADEPPVPAQQGDIQLSGPANQIRRREWQPMSTTSDYKKGGNERKDAHSGEEKEETKHLDQQQQVIESLQTSWSAQTGGVTLHPHLCQALLRQEFWVPTPVQSAALPAAILGRRNIVGAAPTGSGKTLAFLLPIGQFLLQQHQTDCDEGNNKDGKINDRKRNDSISKVEWKQPLQALILTPTRELALQIHAESEKLLGKGLTGTLVGGLAHAKQIRVLEKKRPPILVATPGRLWEMVRGIWCDFESPLVGSMMRNNIALDIHCRNDLERANVFARQPEAQLGNEGKL